MSAPHLLRPDSIFAVTSDPENIRNEYLGARNLWEAVLPPFNDDSGSVCITNAEGMIIDQVEFDEKMHSPFIRDKEGVSLERLAKDVQSGEPSNWKSAASAAGFATPGYLNSSNVSLANADTEIRIEPEIFMAVTGVPDFATIHYAFDQANLVANIGIFDSGGRLVKTVTRNALLGTSGFFRWEGDMDDGARARVGSYMVKVELFDQTGTRRVILKRVVVSGRF
jgi:hypothetical protein